MSYAPCAWISHPDCLLHEIDPEHPESAARLHAIQDRLTASGLAPLFELHEAPKATRGQLTRVHDPEYVEALLNADTRNGPVRIDTDTSIGPHTMRAALRAAGAAVRAVDLVLDGRATFAFCAVRPPGHHAERARAMGFCFFNNIAVAAAHALERGLSRVAILDFDVHYGNGTADIAKRDPRMTLLSTYQHPLYPHWAGAPDASNLVDVPLAAQSGSTAFRAAVTEHWLPRLEVVRPQLILVSAGFDAHHSDPLGGLRLRTEDFAWIGQVIGWIADECCRGRVVAALEGGYELHALARCVEAFVRPFVGSEVPA